MQLKHCLEEIFEIKNLCQWKINWKYHSNIQTKDIKINQKSRRKKIIKNKRIYSELGNKNDFKIIF